MEDRRPLRVRQRPQSKSTAGWSARFSPTPGRSTTTGSPIDRRCAAGPMPDRNKIDGLPCAPAARTVNSPRQRRSSGARHRRGREDDVGDVRVRRIVSGGVPPSGRYASAVTECRRVSSSVSPTPTAPGRLWSSTTRETRPPRACPAAAATPGWCGNDDRDRAVAVPRLIAERRRLKPREVREHVVEAPARVADRPLVVVGGDPRTANLVTYEPPRSALRQSSTMPRASGSEA